MALRASELRRGDHHEEVVIDNLTRTQLVQYAGASGDYNPVHTDEVFATKVAGLPTVFAHGMLTMGLVGKALTHYVGDGRLLRYGARFVARVWPGDTLRARATVEAVRAEAGVHVVDLSVTAWNQQDEVVLTGTASARTDP